MNKLQFTTSQRFPASLAHLWLVCSQRAYVESKYRALGDTSMRLLEFRGDGRSIEVTLERVMPMPVMRLASALLPAPMQASVALRHHTLWERVASDRAKVRIEITVVDLPLKATATGTLRESEPGCTSMDLNWQVHCATPLIADAAQRIFSRQIRRTLQRDHEFTLGYLRDA